MKDILVDENFVPVLKIVKDDSGMIVSDIQSGNIDYQRIRMILLAQKGEFKEFPTLGFGIDNYLNANTAAVKQRFVNEMTKELKSDGMNARITVGDKLSDFLVEI